MDYVTAAPFSIADVREALSHWHRPKLLAHTRFARHPLVRSHAKVGASDLETAATARDVLLEAFLCLGVVANTPAERSRAERAAASLVYRQFVLRKSIPYLMEAESISRATFFRQQGNELSELCTALGRMTQAGVAEPAGARSDPLRFVQSDVPDIGLFVGRRGLIGQARAVLLDAAHARAAVLLGIPGAGKTTLAAALTQDAVLREHFTDGVLWADLGAEREPERVEIAWLRDLGVPASDIDEMTPDVRRSTLRSALSGRRVLIVLDDVWSSGQASALMLGGRNAAYVLTTRLTTLAHELPGRVLRVDALEPPEAVELLELELPPALLRPLGVELDLAEIASWLNGLPLQLHMAVRHLRALAITGQARRLVDTVSPEGLRAALGGLAERVAASLDLLDDAGRAAWAALSVLPPKPNTFGEALALAVGDCAPAVLDQLVDAGLLESARGRYAMHEALREVALARAIVAAPRERLIAFVAAALEAEPETAFDGRDVGNVRAALEAAAALRQHDHHVAIALGAAWLFESTAEYELEARVLREVLARPLSPAQSRAARAHLTRAEWSRGHSPETEQALQALLAEAEAAGDTGAAAVARETLAEIAFERERFDESIRRLSAKRRGKSGASGGQLSAKAQASAVRRYIARLPMDAMRGMLGRILPAAQRRGIESSHIMVGVAAKAWLDFMAGEVGDAVDVLDTTRRQAQGKAHRLPFLLSSGALAFVRLVRGEVDLADSLAHEVLAAPDRGLIPEMVTFAHNTLARVAMIHGDADGAEIMLAAGLEYSAFHRTDTIGATLRLSSAELLLARGRFGEARAAAEAALATARERRFDVLVPMSLALIGAAHSRLHEFEAAERCFAEAVRAGRPASAWANAWAEGSVLRWMGEHALAKGDAAGAAAHLARAVEVYRARAADESLGPALFVLARALRAQGREREARAAGEESLAVLRRMGAADAAGVGAWVGGGGDSSSLPAGRIAAGR